MHESPCPITGAPPVRLVQSFGAGLLADLWRYGVKVNVTELFTGIKRFSLWESPTGLKYFDPPLAGDHRFYSDFYRRVSAHEHLSNAGFERGEFALAAKHVRPGDRVLDVGCGEGGFRSYLPAGAVFTGLDPNYRGAQPDVLAESIEEHAASNPAAYDVICAFQVLEHVPDPLAFVRAMLSALRPGGRLVVGVPYSAGLMTRIPNFIVNLPPHHLTLWNPSALQALAAQLELADTLIEPVPVTREVSFIYWMGKMSPNFHTDRLVAHDWKWHVALAWAYVSGSLLDRFLPVPKSADPLSLLLVARKP